MGVDANRVQTCNPNKHYQVEKKPVDEDEPAAFVFSRMSGHKEGTGNLNV